MFERTHTLCQHINISSLKYKSKIRDSFQHFLLWLAFPSTLHPPCWEPRLVVLSPASTVTTESALITINFYPSRAPTSPCCGLRCLLNVSKGTLTAQFSLNLSVLTCHLSQGPPGWHASPSIPTFLQPRGQAALPPTSLPYIIQSFWLPVLFWTFWDS